MEVILPLVAGIALSGATQLTKKYVPQVSPEVVVILLSLLLGGAYTALSQFAPEEFVEKLGLFATMFLAYSQLVYNFFKSIKR